MDCCPGKYEKPLIDLAVLQGLLCVDHPHPEKVLLQLRPTRTDDQRVPGDLHLNAAVAIINVIAGAIIIVTITIIVAIAAITVIIRTIVVTTIVRVNII